MVTKTYEFLRNFLRSIPEKFPGTSQNLFFYLIPLKIRKHGGQDREFLETNFIIEFP